MRKFNSLLGKISDFFGLKNLYNIKVISLAALFVAISVLAGKVLAFPKDGSVRFSLENFPILLSGIMFGPILGVLVGVLSDFLGCIVVGFTINPIIMAGCASIGLISGVLYRFRFCNLGVHVFIAVFTSHAIGSIFIKSIGLYVYYGYNLQLTIFWRSINYLIIGLVEFLIIYMLLKNKGFKAQMNRILE